MIRRWEPSSYVQRPSYVFMNTFSSEGLVNLPVSSEQDVIECDQWVTCKFSPNSDTLLYLGSNHGFVAAFDVRNAYGNSETLEGGRLSSFRGHDAVIMDLNGVPNKPHQLLTVGGDSNARLWDISRSEEPTSTLFFGHEATVRAACFAPHDPDVFATGGRDGQIRLWDLRISPKQDRRSNIHYLPSTCIKEHAHAIKDVRTTPSRSTPRKKAAAAKGPTPNVTSLLYLDDHSLVSGSDKASTGLRIWDTRKMSTYVNTLEVPGSIGGVTSLALDRFGNSLFAAITDNHIYEYAVRGTGTKPVRSLSGASIKGGFSYEITLCTSPIADQVLCGSHTNGAVMWDLEGCRNRSYTEELMGNRVVKGPPTSAPTHRFGGHNAQPVVVSWSCQGNYVVSMDSDRFRIWSSDAMRDKEEQLIRRISEKPDYERVEIIPLPVAISPSRPITRSVSSSPLKRVVIRTPPMNSPHKSPHRGRTSAIANLATTPTKSPRAKRHKLENPVLPLSNMTNSPSKSVEQRIRKRKTVFNARYPTWNLPNLVYANFLTQLRRKNTPEPTVEARSPSMSSRKRLEDFGWQRQRDGGKRIRLPSVSEFGESVCSKMSTEEERVLQASPRKLVLKKTPMKAPPTKEDRTTDAEHTKVDTRRRSSRNLFDYFQKTGN